MDSEDTCSVLLDEYADMELAEKFVALSDNAASIANGAWNSLDTIRIDAGGIIADLTMCRRMPARLSVP
jgi:hypothetical protein